MAASIETKKDSLKDSLTGNAALDMGLEVLESLNLGAESIWAYREKNPELFDKTLKEYQIDKETIKTQADLKKLNIEIRMMLLLQSWASDSWLGSLLGMQPSSSKDKASDASPEAAKAPSFPEALKQRILGFKFTDFKAFHEKAASAGLKFLPDSGHAIWTERKLFDGFETLKNLTLDKPGDIEKWPDSAPFIPQSRMVLGQSKAELDKIMTWAKPYFDQAGLSLSLIEPGKVLTEKPGDKELQIVTLNESTDPAMESELDWELAKTCLELRKANDVPTQFSSCLKSLAGSFVLEGKTAQEACDLAGIAKPSEAFLKALANRPKDETKPEIAIDPFGESEPN